MATFRNNILANLLGAFWIGALTIVITPIQVRLLGMEAYGVIGLITVLQVMLGTFDLGLSATVTRTVASDHSVGHSASAPLVNSVATLYWLLALIIAGTLWCSADWLAAHWLKPTNLDREIVATSIKVIAIYLALRWPVALYTGLLSGLQRMGVLNGIKSAVTGLRLFGGLVVLILRPDLILFLVWFAASAGLEVLAFAVIAHRLMPALSFRPVVSLEAIKGVWKFSAMMSGLAVISLIVTQADRLIISRLLSLEALGYYALAYNIVMGVSLIQVAINNAALPAFFSCSMNRAAFMLRYDKAGQLLGSITVIPYFWLVFFGGDLVRVWIGEQAASGAHTPLMLIAIGFYLNAVSSNGNTAAIALGRPVLSFKLNLLGVTVYLPALYFLTRGLGLAGAAGSWAILNMYYVAAVFILVHKSLLGQPAWSWLIKNTGVFLLFGLAVFGSAKWVASLSHSDAVLWLAAIIAPIIYAAISWRRLSPAIRAEVVEMSHESIQWLRSSVVRFFPR